MAAYATRTELVQLGIASAAISGISTTDQDAALEAASRKADSYLNSAFKLPITSWGADLKEAVCAIAAFILLKNRGFDPENPADAAIAKGNDDAMKWLRDIAEGKATPILTDSQTGGTADMQFGPFVQTPDGDPEPRGW